MSIPDLSHTLNDVSASISIRRATEIAQWIYHSKILDLMIDVETARKALEEATVNFDVVRSQHSKHSILKSSADAYRNADLAREEKRKDFENAVASLVIRIKELS